MAEILFKAKAINRDVGYHRTEYKNGDWVYGLITRLYDEHFPHLPAEMTDENGVSRIKVDYKTIGLYTGKELDGKKIFTGDIVESYEDYDDICGYPITSTFISVAIWDDKNFCFAFKTDDYIQSFNDWNWENSRVIGNIHDNGELMKGE